MPNAEGRFMGVVVPTVPWCLKCKLVACKCKPFDAKAAGRRAVEKHGEALARLSQ